MNAGTANRNTQEWHYEMNGLPFEPEDMYYCNDRRLTFSNVVSLNLYYKDYNGENRWLSVATDRGTKVLVKAFYGLLRELACNKSWEDFQKYGREVNKKRHGGYWNVMYK